MFDLEPGRRFSPKVLYVYEKQLEEAEIIVINKQDLLPPEKLAALKAALASRFPRAEILVASAREGTGLDEWFTRVLGSESGRDPAPDIDYEEYAEGEALLGWYNGTASLRTESSVDGNLFLLDLAHTLQQQLASQGIEIAHLKMTLTPQDFGSDIAVLNLVRTDGRAELSHLLRDEIAIGQLIVNLRAEGMPDTLHAAAARALADVARSRGVTATIEHEESFSPAKPNPTYRMVTVTASA